MIQPDRHYTDPALADLYDIDSGWSVDRDYYRALPMRPNQCILDLGCGTGLLATAYASDGHSVTGIDPAPAMLDIARTRPGGDAVTWIHGTDQHIPAHACFDLVVMTGHAFQVLLTDRAINQCFQNIARHLAPNGRFVFETRNPAIDWPAKWQGARVLSHPNGDIPQHRQIDQASGEEITFTTTYHLPNGPQISTSTLRFAPLTTITRLARNAGLKVAHLAGDWSGAAFDPEESKEIILHLAPA